jgi:hypothetical protein
MQNRTNGSFGRVVQARALGGGIKITANCRQLSEERAKAVLFHDPSFAEPAKDKITI